MIEAVLPNLFGHRSKIALEVSASFRPNRNPSCGEFFLR
jgi:hypothetical protein